METKNCPYCGGEIMKTAKKCKHCGEWLEDRPQETSTQTSTNFVSDEVEIKHSNTKKIMLIVVGVLVLVFVIWIIILKNQKSDWEKAMEQYNSQSSYIEDEVAVPVEEVVTEEVYEEYPIFESGGPSPYDGIPDGEDEEDYYNSNSDPYNPYSNANAWE